MAYRCLVDLSPALASSTLALAIGACASSGPVTMEPDGHAEGESIQTSELFTFPSAPPPTRQLVLGRAHGCSFDPAISGILCWGDATHGQTQVPALRNPTFVAAGGDVSCAIANGWVKCWGDNSHRQRAVPWWLYRPTQLAVGGTHVCALTAAATVECWGDNTYGQLDVPELDGVESIVAGGRHTCALTGDGVVCWGDNALGQLDAPALAEPTQLALGEAHSCAIDAGQVVCWGGEVPALLDAIPSVTEPVALAAGGDNSCVLDATGVQCWGAAPDGLAPRELTKPWQLAVGGSDDLAHACVRHQQGVACWGDNSLGQTAYDGAPLHLLYRSQAEIAAPPAVIWKILMDLPSYPLWNPYTTAMKSTLKVGDPMVMTVVMNPLVTIEQTEHIRVLEEGHKVCWGIETTTPALNSGERCQWLEPLPNGGTRYVTEDLIEGTLNPLVTALFGNDVKVGFDGVAASLKKYAESLPKTP